MIIFKREGILIELVIYGIYTYSSKLSSEILKPLINRSHESIRN